MARKFKELEDRMSPEVIVASNELHVGLKDSMAFEELRTGMRMTQQELAETLDVDQSALPKLER